MNDSIKKGFNALFRTVVICTAVAAVSMAVLFIKTAVYIADNDGEVASSDMMTFVNSTYSISGMDLGVFYASIACAVLSILSGYKCTKFTQGVRTTVFAYVVFRMAKGLSVASALRELGGYTMEFDADELKNMTNLKMADKLDIPVSVIQDVESKIDNEEALVAMFLALFLSAFLYGILFCTSLHNLLKKQPAAQCGGCDDADKLEHGDAAMLAGGAHYNTQNAPEPGYQQNNTAQQLPQILQDLSRELGGNIESSKLISRYLAAKQPAHDHHDSAAAHDLEADGEFHNYAQAEADMTSDSSDYIDELRREESGGNITDEDFM